MEISIIFTQHSALIEAEGEGVDPQGSPRLFSTTAAIGLPSVGAERAPHPHESGWLDLNQRSPAPEACGFNQALPHPKARGLTPGGSPARRLACCISAAG